ncbi:hypothetical protein [Rhizobium sp. FKL33]|uniref:hypothetical protein n=1 Tax=Rhizobium sp. FKL33 TaxID=2562307 RepID=UPI0010C12A26|nr:hypothetical protein [Rhizobium sp. FKL33]
MKGTALAKFQATTTATAGPDDSQSRLRVQASGGWVEAIPKYERSYAADPARSDRLVRQLD